MKSDCDPPVRPQPTLQTLPSELRKLIISHLAPDPDCHRPGSKQDLKNANATHPCLREWALEYMFRDMALNHVLVGMSSQLERFAVDPSNIKLLSLVKHIKVQIPPGIRWEIAEGVADYSRIAVDTTIWRLRSKFGIGQRPGEQLEMTDEQFTYCHDYYTAMVEPFTDNRTWYRLQRSASSTWRRVLSYFTNVTRVSVGCCEIVDHPCPTSTSTFLSQYGKNVVEELNPRFVEDAAGNMAWASSLIIQAVPSHVQHLSLSMANMDSLNAIATINRLQRIGFSYSRYDRLSANLTKLTLDIRGIAGTHGSRDWREYTGSAGPVKHWKAALNKIKNLQHLELRDAMRTDGVLDFSHFRQSVESECIVDWLLPDLVLENLHTLCLVGFVLNVSTIQETLSGKWPLLERLFLSDISLLMKRITLKPIEHPVYTEYLHGKSWLETCRTLRNDYPGWYIILDRPGCVADHICSKAFDLHPDYVKALDNIAHVEVRGAGHRGKVYEV